MAYTAHVTEEDGVHLVQFPDFEQIRTFGHSLDEALAHAEEALNGCVASDFERGYEIPEPTEASDGYKISLYPHVAVAIELRRARGSRSQVELAKELGVSYQAYQRLENPRRSNPTLKTLEKIAKVLGKELEVSLK